MKGIIMTRKLATVARVHTIEPISGAENIELGLIKNFTVSNSGTALVSSACADLSTSGIFEMYENNTPEEVNTLLTNVSDAYVLVQWPESQEFMEEEWFEEESILALGSEDKTGSSAYFIPLKRVI